MSVDLDLNRRQDMLVGLQGLDLNARWGMSVDLDLNRRQDMLVGLQGLDLNARLV